MNRLDAGHWCFVARHEGQLVSASWASIHRVLDSYLACEIPMMEDEVYIYDSFTGPGFRGQAVSPAIRAEMMRYFRHAGYRRMLVVTIPENNSNLSTLRKVGFHPFGMIGYIKIGPWQWDFYRTSENSQLGI
jgi:GNAT superfamily N-acetyltransferase